MRAQHILSGCPSRSGHAVHKTPAAANLYRERTQSYIEHRHNMLRDVVDWGSLRCRFLTMSFTDDRVHICGLSSFSENC